MLVNERMKIWRLFARTISLAFRFIVVPSAVATMAIAMSAVADAIADANNALANVRVLPRSIADFSIVDESLSEEEIIWVEGVRPAWVNYSALKRDFPKLQSYSHAEIDRLLIENFSFISASQLDLTGIRNTAIPTDSDHKRVSFRPSHYGRADIVEFLDFDGTRLGLIDRKGSGINKFGLTRNQKLLSEVGAESLQTRDHSDGLMSLGEGLVEATRERARQRLYQIENTDSQVVESYFVLHFPFEILKGNGSTTPAGLYGRQAHLGHMNYGFRTPIPQSEVMAEQQDHFGSGFDHGSIRITDARLRSTFGAFGESVRDPQKMADWVWAHETAASFAQSGDRSIVDRHVRDMLAPLDRFGTEKIGSRGESVNSEIESFFEKYSKSNRPEFRKSAATAIRRFATEAFNYRPELRKTAEDLINDPSDMVREEALYALNHFSENDRSRWLERLSQNGTNRMIEIMLVDLKLSDSERIAVYEFVTKRLTGLGSDERLLLHKTLTQALQLSRFYNPNLKMTLLSHLNSPYGLPASHNKCELAFKWSTY